MTPTHNILVCTEDSVLAKKVRILLAREECEVEILASPRRLDRRLTSSRPSLLVVSGRLSGEDAVSVLSKLGQRVAMPPTIVIGSDAKTTPGFVTVISDPQDTQAIYRVASDVLQNGQPTDDPTLPPIDRAQLVASSGKTQRMATLSLDDTVDGEDEPPLDLDELEFPSEDQIAGRLTAGDDDAFEGEPVEDIEAEAKDPRPDAPLEDITVFNVATYHAAQGKNDPHGISGALDASRFARGLFASWTMEAQGALVITTPEEALTIYLEGGLPVHVESNLHGDLLGRNLVSKGRLTDAQYGDAAKMAIERGWTLGHAIVELGFLTREAYGRELGEDAHDRIVRRFAAKAGTIEFIPNKKPIAADRPYRLAVGRILVEGLKRFCDDVALANITGEIEPKYFRLRSSVEELAKRFPLTEKEKAFLAFSGRAYNVSDAAESSGLDTRGARVVMALLLVSDEFQDFTPGVQEFEARIREERVRQSEIKSARPQPSDLPPAAPPPAPPPVLRSSVPEPARPAPPPPPMAVTAQEKPPALFFEPSPIAAPKPPPPPLPAALPPAAPSPFAPPPMAVTAPQTPPAAPEAPPPPPPPAPASEAAPPPNGASIPPMPVPASGAPGRVPRPVVFSPPLPRNADGQAQETPERSRSRQHFQRGVTLLGQGNFDDAEEAFRDAIALCSEEHVYLIGLARALYYNPSYTAQGKVPVLRTIVDRAGQLAPDDGRVLTLTDWVRHAERA
ncbi:MAG: hypothetical protein U1E65_05790 [Myxococcota bacterium]